MSGTFVAVGNARQPFERLVLAVSYARRVLPAPIVFQHGHTPLGQHTFDEVIDFASSEEFTARVKAAEVLILHGGAGSIIEAIAAGKKPFVLPRASVHGEHINDHQVAFVKSLAERGAVIPFDDGPTLKAVLAQPREEAICTITESQPEIVELVARLLAEMDSKVRGSRRVG